MILTTVSDAQSMYSEVLPALSPNEKMLKTEIILGSPGSGCEGVGICRVMVLGEQWVSACRKITAWLIASDEGRFRITFAKGEMDENYLKRHFDCMEFQVVDRYEIPKAAVRILGMDAVTIYPGTYKVKGDQRFLTVFFS